MFDEFDENDKSEDFLADFRNKVSQEQQASFIEKKEEINRSKNILIGAVSGIVLAAVVGFVAFAPKFEDAKEKELPVVRRPQSAIKVQPMDPGGMEIANQDKSVYDIIETKGEGVSSKVESILPAPEVAIKPVVVEKNVSVSEIINEAEKGSVKKEVVEVKKISVAKPAVAVEAEKAVEVAKKNETPKPVEVVKKVEAPKPVAAVKKVEAPKKAVVVEAKKVPEKAVASGLWQVQIISSQNKKAVEASKASYANKYAPLKSVILEVETAIIAGKGTFYRLKAGAFSSKAQADKLCSDLKKLGLSCFSKKK